MAFLLALDDEERLHDQLRLRAPPVGGIDDDFVVAQPTVELVPEAHPSQVHAKVGWTPRAAIAAVARGLVRAKVADVHGTRAGECTTAAARIAGVAAHQPRVTRAEDDAALLAREEGNRKARHLVGGEHERRGNPLHARRWPPPRMVVLVAVRAVDQNARVGERAIRRPVAKRIATEARIEQRSERPGCRQRRRCWQWRRRRRRRRRCWSRQWRRWRRVGRLCTAIVTFVAQLLPEARVSAPVGCDPRALCVAVLP